MYSYPLIEQADFPPQIGVSLVGWNVIKISHKVKKISPKVLLYYTDGDGSYPENKPQYPVIWLMTSNSTIPPWGKIIKLEEE